MISGAPQQDSGAVFKIETSFSSSCVKSFPINLGFRAFIVTDELYGAISFVVSGCAAALFCCEAPEMICGLTKLQLAFPSAWRWGENDWTYIFWWTGPLTTNVASISPTIFVLQLCPFVINTHLSCRTALSLEWTAALRDEETARRPLEHLRNSFSHRL